MEVQKCPNDCGNDLVLLYDDITTTTYRKGFFRRETVSYESRVVAKGCRTCCETFRYHLMKFSDNKWHGIFGGMPPTEVILGVP